MVVLASAAVWMGGLNQDEGWYLYAANMVADGHMPYRDFAYTQGPLMPIVYSFFSWVWNSWGLLGARVFTLVLGLAGILFAVAIARRLAPEERKAESALIAFLLLAVNLYHLYYLAIPKTYALGSLLVLMGFFLLPRHVFFAAVAFAFAAGTRISLGLLLAVVGCWFLFARHWREVAFFTLGGLLGLILVYGPFLADSGSLAGLIAAQRYHAARSGFDLVWTVGSFSRLVRWYLPIFIVLGLGFSRRGGKEWLLFIAFAAVFTLQMLAPFPYEDYQVPVMALLAVFAAVRFSASAAFGDKSLLLVFGLAFATAFGSPLLERWSVNGQDRFWSLKKDSTELAQLRDVARRIEKMDPGGKKIFTQDLYLAIETGRKVPRGLEMGPFSILDDDGWKRLLGTADAPVAALSGYTFAVEPPACTERSIEKQMEYWQTLKRSYELADKVDAFGQNATTLLILRRKGK